MVAHGGSTVFTLSLNTACVGQPFYGKLRLHNMLSIGNYCDSKKINANLVEYDFQKNEINVTLTKEQKLVATKEVKLNIQSEMPTLFMVLSLNV